MSWGIGPTSLHLSHWNIDSNERLSIEGMFIIKKLSFFSHLKSEYVLAFDLYCGAFDGLGQERLQKYNQIRSFF